MPTRRLAETAGFFVIAASLHVAAFAAFLPDDGPQKGAAADAPPAQLAAGGAEVQAMVAEWEAPPEIAEPAPAPQPQPEPVAEPAPQQPEPAPEPVRTAALPQPMPAQPSMSQPNLPEPPEAPEIEAPSELALSSSTRPDARPERPAPRRQPEPEPDPQPRREPQRQVQPAQQPQQRQAAPAPQRAGQGGASQSSRSGGGGGVSAAQRQSAMSRWGGQVQSCIARRAQRPRGIRESGTTLLSINIGRDGTIRGIGVARSSGSTALDQAAAQAAQRARRCPAAPSELTDASYAFTLPVTLN